MAWSLEGEGILTTWLAGEDRPEVRDHVVDWVVQLLRDPLAVEAERVPGYRLDVRGAFVPGADVGITFLVVDRYRVVRLLEIMSFT